MSALFNFGDFLLHSGGRSNFKIDCDALTRADLHALASLVAGSYQWSSVHGIPRGGLRFAEALRTFTQPGVSSRLIVDDVFTTGASMESARRNHQRAAETVIGIVIFSRGPTPDWVHPLFRGGPDVVRAG
jgi:orotate phosphoribosyltransferase